MPGTASVDLNTILAPFMERVEVLTGGASASYGSDAVSGFVNVILKKDLRGLLLEAMSGESGTDGDRLKAFSATYGLGNSDGTDFLVANLSGSQQGAAYSRCREASPVDQLSTTLAISGKPEDIFKATHPFYSWLAPQSSFFYEGAFTASAASLIENSPTTPTAREFR